MTTNTEILLEIKRSSIDTKMIFIYTMALSFLAVSIAIREQPYANFILAVAIIYFVLGTIWGVYRKYIKPPK